MKAINPRKVEFRGEFYTRHQGQDDVMREGKVIGRASEVRDVLEA